MNICLSVCVSICVYVYTKFDFEHSTTCKSGILKKIISNVSSLLNLLNFSSEIFSNVSSLLNLLNWLDVYICVYLTIYTNFHELLISDHICKCIRIFNVYVQINLLMFIIFLNFSKTFCSKFIRLFTNADFFKSFWQIACLFVKTLFLKYKLRKSNRFTTCN